MTEEEEAKILKPIPAPSRLDTMLISHQIRQFCEQITSVSNQTLSRLYCTQGIVSDARADPEDGDDI